MLEAQAEALEFPHGLKASRRERGVRRHARAPRGAAAAAHRRRRGAGAPGRRLAGRQWNGEVLALEGNGKVPFILRAPAPLKASPERVELGNVAASIGDGRLLVRELTWSKERVGLERRVQRLPAQWLDHRAWRERAPAFDAAPRRPVADRGSADALGSLSVRRAAATSRSSIRASSSSACRACRSTRASRRPASACGWTSLRAMAAPRSAGQIGREPRRRRARPGRELAALGAGAARARAREAHRAAVPRRHALRRPRRRRPRGRGHARRAVFSGTLRGDALAFDYPPLGIYLKNGAIPRQARRQNPWRCSA